MKAAQSGLGLKERSAFYFSHTRWFLKKDCKAEPKYNHQSLVFDVCPLVPPPSLELMGEAGGWCGFLTPSGRFVLRLSHIWQPHLKPGMSCLSSIMNRGSQASPNPWCVSVLPQGRPHFQSACGCGRMLKGKAISGRPPTEP